MRNHVLILSLSKLELAAAQGVHWMLPRSVLIGSTYGRDQMGEDRRFQRNMTSRAEPGPGRKPQARPRSRSAGCGRRSAAPDADRLQERSGVGAGSAAAARPMNAEADQLGPSSSASCFMALTKVALIGIASPEGRTITPAERVIVRPGIGRAAIPSMSLVRN